MGLFTLLNLREQESNRLTNYDNYYFSIKEILLYLIEGIGLVALLAYVFYRSYIAVFILSPVIVLLFKKKKTECREKRKLSLSIQFRELMSSLIAGLHAGYSVENAFLNSYQDMVLLFGKKSMIARELGYIAKSLKNNRNIEELLDNLGERSNIDDIRDFAEIFRIAKRSGGDLPAMIQQTADVISDKMEVRRRITTLISSKKLEQSIMNMVPFGIILYIDASSPGFFDSLYHNITGIMIMTVLMVIYFVAYVLSEKIMNIKI